MGILITSQGGITLPGALIMLGVPMLSIGKSYCNRSTGAREANRRLLHYSSTNDAWSCPLFWNFHGNAIPFQWMVGLAFCYLAMICILIESGIFSMFRKSHRDPSTSSAENEADVETELMASHYHLDEISKLVQENVTCASQLYMNSPVSNPEYDGAGRDPSANVINDTKAASQKRINSVMSTSKYQNLESKGVIHLNALALKVSKSEAYSKDKNKVQDFNKLIMASQEAAYKSISAYPRSDQMQSAAISLLALVAKYDLTRERNLYQADEYGLDVPIRTMRNALKRAKCIDEEGKDNDLRMGEIRASELQRKACLYLGALTDSQNQSKNRKGKETDTSFIIATKIVEEDGLIAILDAIDWFRFHEEVVNWGLWAVFMLCYNHVGNKVQFVRMDGISKVCRAIKTIVEDYQDRLDRITRTKESKEDGPVSLVSRSSAKEVARHGIAILFDVLRYDEKSNATLDFTQVRRLSLNAGMHEIMVNAMSVFRDSTDIMMMGQQMLVATGYTGNIPHYEGAVVPMR